VPLEGIEFTDRDGNPLPPEKQRELREKLKDKLPTLVKRRNRRPRPGTRPTYALSTDGGRDTVGLYRLMPSRNSGQASRADSA
jgi:hypothetical protein